VHSVDEVEEFLAMADALVVNVGTLSREWVASMQLAAITASKLGKPWVLDPVGAGATKFRTKVKAVKPCNYTRHF
jgi:hydroxyethylthiazole kinase